jgi:rhodanese-related sulfurtransferase
MEQYMQFATNHYILTLAWIGVFVLFIYSFIGGRLRGYASVNPAGATQLINREQAIVLDVREENEYLNGHIVNSLHIPMSYLNDRMSELDKYKDKPVIVSCRSGQRSGHACALLKKQGFENVYNLSGGMMAWQNDSLPVTKK